MEHLTGDEAQAKVMEILSQLPATYDYHSALQVLLDAHKQIYGDTPR